MGTIAFGWLSFREFFGIFVPVCESGAVVQRVIALDAGGAIPIVRSFSSHLSRIPRHFVCCRGIHVERT